MKLLTHNFLSSRFLKDAKQGYPLILNVNEKKQVESEFDAELITSLLGRIDYSALKIGAQAIEEASQLPDSLPEKMSEELLRELHRLLYCVDVVDGSLTCPDTGRVFPIKDGIPNMLCKEDEAI